MNNTNTISLCLTVKIKSTEPCYPSMFERSELRRIHSLVDLILSASNKQDAQISVGMVDGDEIISHCQINRQTGHSEE